MSAKRALIVDDSLSARTFLTRVLERYDLQVDSAASAEEAIEYLIRHRPDVIFLDHLMPGMDGFEALTAIKNDPRTATIPVMMYTSQEGELYLSQARALGAMGVLPKQTRPADVSRALEQLRLLDEHRAEADIATVRMPSLRDAAEMPATESPPPGPPVAAAAGGLTPEMRAQLDLMLRDHGIELRRFVAQSLSQHTGQIISEVRSLVDGSGEHAVPPVPEESTLELPQLARSGNGVMWLTSVAAAVALFAAVLWYQASNPPRQRTPQDPDPAALAPAAPAGTMRRAPRPAPAGAVAGRGAAPRNASVVIEPVPFGEPPLAGARIEAVQNILARLVARGFQGTVEIRSIPGRFCLQGNGDAAVLAAPELSVSKCEQIGNPVDSGSVAGRESVAFANMLSAQHSHERGAFEVQLAAGDVDEVVAPYPTPSAALTAGEWNRAAAANNRVEVRAHPLP